MAKNKTPPKRGASRNLPPAKKSPPGWFWLACLLAIGGFGLFLAKLGPGGHEVKREAVKEPLAAKPRQPAKPKYDFYTLLPGNEVVSPPSTRPAAPAPAPAAPPKLTPEQDAARALALLENRPPPLPPAPKPTPATSQFFLQAGSFRRREEAESARARLSLLGERARIEAGNVRGETYHRVITGPYANRQQLEKAQKQLASNGFPKLLPQERRIR